MKSRRNALSADLPSELGEAFTAYLARRRSLADRTRLAYRYNGAGMVEYFVGRGAETVDAITVALADDWISWLLKSGRRPGRQGSRHGAGKGLDPATVKARHAMASGFFQNLTALGQLPRNPFATVEVPKLKKRVRRIEMSWDDAESIIAELPASWYGARLRLILGLGLHAAARIDEILKLNWGDIRWDESDHGLITLDGKGGKERNIALTGWLADELARYKRDWAHHAKGFANAPIFLGRKKHRLAHKAVYSAIERFDLKSRYGLHPHLLRHVSLSELVRGNVPLHDIKAFAGHKSITTTEIYLHSVAADTRKAAHVLGARSRAPHALPAVQPYAAPKPVPLHYGASVGQGETVLWRSAQVFAPAA